MKDEMKNEMGDDAKALEVNLGGIVPLSTVDWVGVAAIVVFLRGCPLRCPHCHNHHLQRGGRESFEEISNVKKEIEKAAPFVSGLVLSGGEPLMQPEAAHRIAEFAHEQGQKVGLETCGYYPERLADLLEEGSIDRVFLDVKAPLQDPEYARATGKEGTASRVRRCLEICAGKGASLEVRTTVFPEMPTAEEVEEIGRQVLEMGIDSLVLQQGHPREGEVPFEPVSHADLRAMARALEGLGVGARVRTKGDEES